MVFGVAYLVLYPGLGTFKGTLGLDLARRARDRSRAQCGAHREDAGAVQRAQRGGARADPAALNIGRNLFLNNCATCHGSDGGGAPGFPNLADDDWLWGGDADTVVTTIAQGRIGVMPPWGAVLGARGVEDMLSYVLSLTGRKLEAGDARAGAAKFAEICSACHGADGSGNAALGAPNLTDDIWLHGGSLAAVRDSIEKGRNGRMPAHSARLGETRIKLLAAYVLSLGRQEQRAVAARQCR